MILMKVKRTMSMVQNQTITSTGVKGNPRQDRITYNPTKQLLYLTIHILTANLQPTGSCKKSGARPVS